MCECVCVDRMVAIGRYIAHLHVTTNVCADRPKGYSHIEWTKERMSCGVTVKRTIKIEHNLVKNDSLAWDLFC